MAVFLLFGMAFAMMTLHVVNPSRAARLEILEADHERLISSVRKLDDQNARLADELQGLESGTDSWRALCRREYGMIIPGEVVFRFPVNAID